MSRIIDFYEGRLKHPRGVAIDSMLRWNHGQLEFEHTYIQWLFPLPERSNAVPSSPILSARDIALFTERPGLREKMRDALRLLLGFYGFTLREEPGTPPRPLIEPGPNFDERTFRWLTPNNHNYLRITRILRSLTTLGLGAEALEFFAALQRIYVRVPEKIGSYSYDFWKKAVQP